MRVGSRWQKCESALDVVKWTCWPVPEPPVDSPGEPTVNPLRTLLTTGLATLLVVGLGACGQDDPTGETTSAQPSPSTSLEDTVTTVFDRYWKQANTANPAEPPSAELKALLTDEAYADATNSAKTFPKITVKGKDEIVASKATAASDTEASVEVC